METYGNPSEKKSYLVNGALVTFKYSSPKSHSKDDCVFSPHLRVHLALVGACKKGAVIGIRRGFCNEFIELVIYVCVFIGG